LLLNNLIIAVSLFLATPVFAAPVNLPGAVEPGHDRPLPQPAPPPSSNLDFSVEAPHRSSVPRAVDEIKFKLVDIKVDGAVTLGNDHFRVLYQKLIGKQVSLADIFDVADAIEKEYQHAGYLLVRAYVPPQHVKDGIFTINIVEGFVESVQVEGGNSPAQSRVKSYMTPITQERPLRLATVERALLLSNDLPGVQATGVLRPSPSVSGASDLIVTLNAPDMSGSIASSNRGSHLSGLWTVTDSFQYNGIFGADEADAQVVVAPHALNQQLSETAHYRTAIGDEGLIGTLMGAVTHGSPAATLGQFDIRTDSWAAGGRLTYPLIRTREETLSLDGGFTAQEAKVDILGVGISHDKWRVADIALTYSANNWLDGAFSSTVDIAQGLPVLGASPSHSPELSLAGRSVFTKFSGLARYTNTFADPFSFSITGNGQYSLEPLITGEQILFGGTQIGRGYDPGAITGDSGVGGSFELRYDTRWSDLAILAMQPYAFFDAAKVWNRSRPPSSGIPLGDFDLESTGIGIRFWFPYNIFFDLEGARTLHAVPGSDNGRETTKLLVDVSIAF
jgi:hemolysin activation/secretion protein